MRKKETDYGNIALRVRIEDIPYDRKLEFSGTLKPAETRRLQEIALETPVHCEFEARLRRDGETLLLERHVEGDLQLSCDRCLALARFQASEKFQLILHPKEWQNRLAEETILTFEDLESDYYGGEWVHLGELLEEQFIISLPSKVLCTEACRGICPGCGVNLNQYACRCSNQAVENHPFASLKKLVEQTNHTQT